MSQESLPLYVDPYRLAEQNAVLAGVLPITEMLRLAPCLSSKEGWVRTSMRFGKDEQGGLYLNGHIETELMLQCQRCMEPYLYEIISDFTLGIVSSVDEINTLSESYEPVMTQEGMLAVHDMVEEEILLNLPLIPKHMPEQCQVSLPLADSGWEQGKADNPFQVLNKLKRKQKS